MKFADVSFDLTTPEGRACIRATVEKCVAAGWVARSAPFVADKRSKVAVGRLHGPWAASVLSSMAGVEQVFTKRELAVRLQVTPIVAANYLYQWNQAGWIAQERFGEWKKTKLFGHHK